MSFSTLWGRKFLSFSRSSKNFFQHWQKYPDNCAINHKLLAEFQPWWVSWSNEFHAHAVFFSNICLQNLDLLVSQCAETLDLAFLSTKPSLSKLAYYYIIKAMQDFCVTFRLYLMNFDFIDLKRGILTLLTDHQNFDRILTL